MNASPKPTEVKTSPVVKSLKVQLSAPLETTGGTINEITLEEPRAHLLLRYGPPFKTAIIRNDDGEQKLDFEFIPDKMGTYVEAMSGIDKASLGEMSMADMFKCFTAVMELVGAGGN